MSLVNHCYDLKFQRPSLQSVQQLVIKVAKREGIDLDVMQAERLVESSGNDIRQVINILQMWSQQAAMGNSHFLSSVAKDESVMINNFDAAHRLLNHGAKNL